ncbi:hypothetical protein J4558_09750 [Leptolyngbya sp. 15MV]|nr:hypothetical protein J4558_09750 [Leptolyngbya sp. 15MV]
MKTISKALVGTVAAGAMAMTSAAPAMARDHRDGGISVGDVIAGAVIIGGIAAVASAIGNGRDSYRYDDRYRYDNRHGNRWGSNYGYSPRAAVEQCVNAVRRDARQSGYRFADVTQIRDVNDRRNGWRVRGNLLVENDRYRGNWNRNDRRGYDTGSFTCQIEYGRIRNINYSGIRGLR